MRKLKIYSAFIFLFFMLNINVSAQHYNIHSPFPEMDGDDNKIDLFGEIFDISGAGEIAENLPETAGKFLDDSGELTGSGEIAEYFNIILKVLGISFLVQIGADICRDLGEESIASKVEFAGKAVILVMVLPILKNIISMVFDLLK